VITASGEEVTRMVPPEQLSTNIRAIYVDEFNRAPKEARNGFMELLQTKGVNGRRFKNLEVVWTSINPSQDSAYDVEIMDPAQEDRFQAHVSLPYDVVDAHFIKKFGENVGVAAVNWWRNMPLEQKLLCSPRRLEEAVDAIIEDDDIKYYLSDKLPRATLFKAVQDRRVKDSIRLIIETMSEDELPGYFTAQRVIDHAAFFKGAQALFKTKVIPYLTESAVSELFNRALETNGLSDLLIRNGMFTPDMKPKIEKPKFGFKLQSLMRDINHGTRDATVMGSKQKSTIPYMDEIFGKFEQIYTFASLTHKLTPTMQLTSSDRLLTVMRAWKEISDELPDLQSKLIFVLSHARHQKQEATHLWSAINAINGFATYEFNQFLKKDIEREGALKFIGDIVGIGASLWALGLERRYKDSTANAYFQNKLFRVFCDAAVKIMRHSGMRQLLNEQLGVERVQALADFMFYGTPRHQRSVGAVDDILPFLARI
jgi:hypothetical protein